MKKYDEKDVNLKEFSVDTTDLTQYKSEDIKLDFKNNILKQQAEQAKSFPANIIVLDKDFRKEYYVGLKYSAESWSIGIPGKMYYALKKAVGMEADLELETPEGF
ncbi:hypothetical protein KIL84_011169 [Mauremys mutica]|uniref:Uncharacterized protein n=1 Tax=Mauremys mutica TaxID=74926 RepID=A0A9D3XDA4_9SAUR|nr:hypothetical protein KIL84_011169 [Mauremys mutica]